MRWIIIGMLLIATAIVLPFDTFFIDFHQFTAGEISLLKLILIAAGLTGIVGDIFG